MAPGSCSFVPESREHLVIHSAPAEGGGPEEARVSWTPPPPEVVPPGFKPTGDPNTPGTTFTHPDTGVSVHWGGTQWVDDASGGPFTHAYDMFTGTTAYQDPKTGTWEVHSPPPGFNIDWNVPPGSVGYYWIDKDDRRIYFAPGSGVWIDAATGQAIPPTTQERPGTGDDASRVDVPELDDIDDIAPVGPPDDTPSAALAKNSIAASKIMAVKHGDLSIVIAPPAKDYQTDLDNLAHSVELWKRMVADGVTGPELTVVETHIVDLLVYLEEWNKKYGAKGVNDAAQNDDLMTQMTAIKAIFDMGLGMADGDLMNHVGKFLAAKGLGGGGSQTVVPKHKTTKSFVGKGPGVTAKPAGGATAKATADTLALPTEAPVRAGTETQGVGGANPGAKGGTVAGRPTTARLEDAQAAALVRQEAANKALAKAEQKQIQNNIKNAYAEAKANPNNTLYGREPGQSVEAAAAKYAREHSLQNTKYDPSVAATKMTTHGRELQEIATGKSSTLAPNQKNLEGMYKSLKETEAAVREGEKKFQDYWQRMDRDTRTMLQEGLESAKGKDLQYWQRKLDATLANPPAPRPFKPDTTMRIDTPPNLPTEASEGKTRIKGGTSALLAGSLIVVVVILAVGANMLNQKPAAAPGESSVAAAHTEAPDESVGAGGGGGGKAACAPAQFLSTLLANVTQAVLDEVCTRQMVDKTGDRTEYNGTAAAVKPAVGDMKSIADPEIILSAEDAAALAKDCHVLDLSGAVPTGAPGPIPAGRWCTATGPAAGTYEVYVVEFADPIASDPDGNWEAGLGYKTGTTATWDSTVADPLTGHNRYVTVRFGTHADAYGPFVGAWSGKQGEFFTDQPTGAFAAIDGPFLAVFIPSTDWAAADACRWFTYYGRTDNGGGAVDLWPDADAAEVDC